MNPYQELCARWPKLLETQLWHAGGFTVLRGFPGDDSLAALRAEAEEIVPKAGRQEWPHPNDVEWRGGQPSRFLRGAGGGPCLNSNFGRPEVLALLRELLASPVRMAGGGSISVYDRPGDALGLHRDIDVCDVTLVTCLWNEGPNEGGALRTYPAYIDKPLSALPAERTGIGVSVAIKPGDTAVLLGGIVPHEVTPMGSGQRRVVSLVCYQMVETNP